MAIINLKNAIRKQTQIFLTRKMDHPTLPQTLRIKPIRPQFHLKHLSHPLKIFMVNLARSTNLGVTQISKRILKHNRIEKKR